MDAYQGFKSVKDGSLSLGPSALDLPLFDGHPPMPLSQCEHISIPSEGAVPGPGPFEVCRRDSVVFPSQFELNSVLVSAGTPGPVEAKPGPCLDWSLREATPLLQGQPHENHGRDQRFSFQDSGDRTDESPQHGYDTSAIADLLDIVDSLCPEWPEGLSCGNPSSTHTVSTNHNGPAAAVSSTMADTDPYSTHKLRFPADSTLPWIPDSPESISETAWHVKSPCASDIDLPSHTDIESSIHELERALAGELPFRLDVADTSNTCSSDFVRSAWPSLGGPNDSSTRLDMPGALSKDVLHGTTQLMYEPFPRIRADSLLPCSPVTPSPPSLERRCGPLYPPPAHSGGAGHQSPNAKTKSKVVMRKPKTYAKPVASRFCHICSRMPRRGQGSAVCRNMAKGLCRKIVCERCIMDNGWNYEAIKASSSTWLCPHCAGLCPARSQCHIYNRINARRKRVDEVVEQRLLPPHTSAPIVTSALQESTSVVNELSSSYSYLLGTSQIENGHRLLFPRQDGPVRSRSNI